MADELAAKGANSNDLSSANSSTTSMDNKLVKGGSDIFCNIMNNSVNIDNTNI